MRTSRFFLYLCVAGCLLGTACEPHWDFGSVNPEPQIVVEGWIEQGAFPVVCLSQTLSLAQTADSIDLSDIPIRWAKVTVSDGTETEVLTGRVNENYTFSYIYTGSKIRGQAGKTYSLKIEYSGRVATAETFIPEPVSLTNIEVRRCEGIDSLIQIKVGFCDDGKEKNYYKLFTQVLGRDKCFFSSFMGTFSDEVLSGEEPSVNVYRGLRYRYNKLNKYTPFFREKECVRIKFTQLSKEGFEFWSSYENEVTNGKNPFFPSSSNLKSNIQGALGIWCGYGVSVYTVNIRDYLLPASAPF